jgi:diacylglycerol kinase family enzyme
MLTTVIINPYAGGGRAAKLWAELEPRLKRHFGNLNATLTHKPDDLGNALEQAYTTGTERVIAIGGDGTSNLVVDALLHLQARFPDQPRPVFGQIPIGTGQDFARALNIPHDPFQAVDWLARAEPHPLDVGYLEYSGQSRYFLIIASVGISGEVDRRVNLV